MKKTIIFLALLTATTAIAREKVSEERAGSGMGFGSRVMAACNPPKASKELWFNNVRTIIYSGGDMWWDLVGNNNAYYYIPAVQNRANGVSSSFAGSIWLGGVDAGGQLKVAAMTYRQTGVDFYPGPLDTSNASTSSEVCNRFDQIFTVTRADVENFAAGGFQNPSTEIRDWPGNGDVSLKHGRRMAPFVDGNSDGFYDPTDRTAQDYPGYDIYNLAEKDNLGFCKTKLFGDYTMFWVFNDMGDIHTETQGVPIGVEVRAQAFAFKTNDEINNMTFYSYEIFNRSSFQLKNTYFTIWNDCDLGYYLDDYVGCDVKRGLGFIYNADPYDETASGVNGYLDYPPSLGCDFFKGPIADVSDGIDNDQDGQVDEPGETIQMSRFTYYNNNIGAFPPQTTNPGIAVHFYNYMTGFWKDGSAFTFGGNAYGGTAPATFVYDGDPVEGTGWTEKGSGNLPGDRRFLQSAGPFTLKPGAVNEIIFGMPWGQSPTKGGNMQSVTLMKAADDKAQALFDNCFKLLDGPEAPNMTIQELPNQLVFYLTNEKGRSNNYKQFNNDYAEDDISITAQPNYTVPTLANPDKKYRFEGYIVYQVRDERVTATDLADRARAIPVFQCDIQNGVGRIVNFELDNNVGGYSPVPKVDGADLGMRSTFTVTTDAFSTLENRQLVNNKQYFFIAVAYAYNNFHPYAQDVSPEQKPNEANFLGQKRPYLEGRKIKRASGIPHIIDNEKGGTAAQSIYGFGPKITRIEGQGNGGNPLTLTAESENAILNSPTGFVQKVTYENARGPLNIRVVDPLNVKEGEFTFRFINHRVKSTAPTTSINAMIAQSTSASTTYTGTIGTLNVNTTSWELRDLSTNKLYHPTEIKGQSAADTLYQTIRVGDEFYFPELGFSVNVKQVADPGESVNKFTDFLAFTTSTASYSGPAPGSFIGASMVPEDGGPIRFLADEEGETPLNWIRSGVNKTKDNLDAYYTLNQDGEIQAFYDPNQQFGKILKGGTWAPYPLVQSQSKDLFTGRTFGGPAFNGFIWQNDPGLKDQNTQSQPDLGNTDLRKISSVLVVFTPDKNKWTRCVVLEMQEKSALSQGGAAFFSPRRHKSVDKNGETRPIGDTIPSDDPNSANFISEYGMSWFPGYAINLETGERLNMAFGEDSYQKENNGNDMLFNPTSKLHQPYMYAMGGKHFVYVFGNAVTQQFWTSGAYGAWEPQLTGKYATPGRYDHGRRLMDIYKGFFNANLFNQKITGGLLKPLNAVEREIMWVSIPYAKEGQEFLKPDQMLGECRIQINVAKPYRYGLSGMAQTFGTQAQHYQNLGNLVSVNTQSNFVGTTSLTAGPGFVVPAEAAQNNNFPMYSFNTADIATLYDQANVLQNSLDLIRVVPNPYYGTSTYETRRIDNIVRITNLPNKCTIKIFTLNGMLVRTIKRDVTGQEDLYAGTGLGGDDIKRTKRVPYVEWDLKNQNNISVASGLYIIHIDAPGIGEKIVKWFGVMRPLDVQNY